jgi:hypothetical protein
METFAAAAVADNEIQAAMRKKSGLVPRNLFILRSRGPGAAPIAAASSTRPGQTTLPLTSSRSEPSVGLSLAASSANASGPYRSPGQGQWPSSNPGAPRARRARSLGRNLVQYGTAWKMKDLWPLGVALRGEAPNRLMLRWLKTVVVRDEEKAHGMRQVETRKAGESEPLSRCRNQSRWHQNLGGGWGCPEMSLAGARVLARRCPAWRRREPGLRLSRGTWC